ncbi:MAG: ketoacyl-ACP synthase III [Xanthomonadaceae bacterium]|nr:ketoacyl-ACP synthase III [Xanthomonadaceae bacterium]
MIRSRIIGSGSFLPENKVLNNDLVKFMDTSDEWIFQRSGIRSRYYADKSQATSDLGLIASQRALENAGVKKEEIDLILCATISPDHEFPGTGCFLQAKLGLSGIPAIDVRQQCSSFIYAIAQADAFIRMGMYKKILVTACEIQSKALDFSTAGRDVTVLFGDGAGSVVIEAVDVKDPTKERCILSSHLHADGSFAKELWLQAPGSAYQERMTQAMMNNTEDHPKMNGKLVFVHAVKRMPEAIQEALNFNNLKISDIDLFLFHQANIRINEATAKVLGIPEEKIFNTIERFGNTTSATIPLGIDTAVKEGKLKPGMLVASAAFGSGFTWASSIYRW